MDDDRTVPGSGTWPWRLTAPAVAAVLVLGGCGFGDDGEKAGPSPSAPPRSATPSPSAPGEGAAPLTPFEADPAKVPRTRGQAEALAEAVALRPQQWGAGFRAQQPDVSPPRTFAVLDAQCRWERRALPRGVLSSLSRYSEIPAADGKGVLKVTASVTVHSTVREADERLASTLEEPLRCRRQQVRADEWISGLLSAAEAYGRGNNTYADDQVIEIGEYLAGNGEQPYHWHVTRLGTVTLAVSVKGAAGYSNVELATYASKADAAMLIGLESELGGDS